MKKIYTTPELRERKLAIDCVIEISYIDVDDDGKTGSYDAKQNSIFDRFGTDPEE